MRATVWFVFSLGLFGSLAHAETLRAVTEDTAYSYMLDGRVAGPASEVVKATLQRAGFRDYELALYPWARAYDMALEEPGVLIYLIARTPEREPLFRWVGEVMRIDYHFYKLRERTDITAADLQAAKRYRVGVLRDDVRHHYLQANGFTQIVVSARNSDNFRYLLNGQVDLAPMPERDVIAQSQAAGIDPARLEKVFTSAIAQGLYMAFSLDTDDTVVQRAQSAFEALQKEGVVRRIMSAQP